MSEPTAAAKSEPAKAPKKPPPPRSPAYPFIGLETALERAETFRRAENRNPTRSEVAASHWGYSAKSSGGRQTLSALRQYGLLEGEGTVKLTDVALRILLDTREESPERQQLIRQVALRPPIHRRLWESYGAELPSDATLRHVLIFEHGFNENVVTDFMREYRATVTFARLAESASMPSEGEEQRETTPQGGAMEPPAPAPARGYNPPPASIISGGGLPPVTFPLSGDNALEIRLRSKIPKAEFDLLKPVLMALLELSVVEKE